MYLDVSAKSLYCKLNRQLPLIRCFLILDQGRKSNPPSFLTNKSKFIPLPITSMRPNPPLFQMNGKPLLLKNANLNLFWTDLPRTFPLPLIDLILPFTQVSHWLLRKPHGDWLHNNWEKNVQNVFCTRELPQVKRHKNTEWAQVVYRPNWFRPSAHFHSK